MQNIGPTLLHALPGAIKYCPVDVGSTNSDLLNQKCLRIYTPTHRKTWKNKSHKRAHTRTNKYIALCAKLNPQKHIATRSFCCWFLGSNFGAITVWNLIQDDCRMEQIAGANECNWLKLEPLLAKPMTWSWWDVFEQPEVNWFETLYKSYAV